MSKIFNGSITYETNHLRINIIGDGKFCTTYVSTKSGEVLSTSTREYTKDEILLKLQEISKAKQHLVEYEDYEVEDGKTDSNT